MLQEKAPARINLTLDILGHRPDGYHELRMGGARRFPSATP